MILEAIKPLQLVMIKIISYVVIAFCYRKANILHRWSNILRIFYENKGLCHGCRYYWLGWKLALLHAAFEQLRYLNLCCVLVQVHCRNLVAFQSLNISTHSLSRFFKMTDNLHLLDCSVTWSLLTRIDTGWTCWRTVDARVRNHKHRIETDSDSGHLVHP